MKDRAGIKALIDVFQELRDRERSALGVQLDGEIAQRSDHLHLGAGGGRSGLARLRSARSAAWLEVKRTAVEQPGMEEWMFHAPRFYSNGYNLEYVLAGRHPIRAQSDGLLALGECAHRFFQPLVGSQERRTLHFADRGYGCRAQRIASPRGADGGIALVGVRLGRGPRHRRPVRAVFAVGAGRLLSGTVRPLGGAGPRLCLLLHPRGAGTVAKTAAHGRQAAALRGYLPRADGRTTRRARGAGLEADAALRGTRRTR